MKKLNALICITNVALAGAAPVDNCGALFESTEVREIASGFQLAEGPLWHSAKQQFIFSSVLEDSIYSLGADDSISLLSKPSDYANGSALDGAGNLWSARHDRKVSKTSPLGKVDIMVAQFAGKKLNSPNDLVIHSDGSVWFTDPSFGIIGYPLTEEQEQPVQGLYRLKQGTLSLMDDQFIQPNGLAFSPDERVLYVAEFTDGWVYSYDLEGDKIVNKRQFAQVANGDEGSSADGVKVDTQGNVWVAGPRALGIFNHAGDSLCRLPIPAPAFTNLAFGGVDGKQVLLTSFDKLYRLQRK